MLVFLIITHSDIGKQMLLTATSVYGTNPFRVELLSVDNFDQPNDVIQLGQKYVNFLDKGKWSISINRYYWYYAI
jgi:mannose/fructose-specific phosphotransferase system component IIA